MNGLNARVPRVASSQACLDRAEQNRQFICSGVDGPNAFLDPGRDALKEGEANGVGSPLQNGREELKSQPHGPSPRARKRSLISAVGFPHRH